MVHGGDRFSDSVLVDNDVIAAIRSFAPLAPLQNPADLTGIEAIRAARPELPQVAVFDTAFHQTMPASAFRYAVPEEWYTRYGVRRYGFHGTSHRFVSERAAVLLGRPLGELRLVTAHLGNGCSAAAIRDGVSVDTTMGLTPLEGLVMGTRSGDIDPGVFAYLADRTGRRAAELTETLNTRSGLLGLSGTSNDMRTVQDAAARGDERARLALDVFVHRLAKAVAGLVTSLERLDALVFTGGIGENSAIVRGLVLARLGFLGLAEDPEANAGARPVDRGPDQPSRPGPGARRADRRGAHDRPRHRPPHRRPLTVSPPPTPSRADGPAPFLRRGPRPAYRLLVVRYRVLISGRVQGVFFRDTCRRLAEQHGVAGWVRNLPDGRVEAVFEGPPEDVRRLVDWAHTGPRLAAVDDVAVQPEPPEGLSAFHIR